MSGITPLIDTLLHQVLGKRVDVPVPRDLNAPVQPASPSDAIKALHSDSRLDPRQQSLSAPLVGRSIDKELPASAAPRPAGQALASTQTHFSPSAQTIASVLDRFPAPPSTLRVQGPLMLAAASTGDSSQLASRLQQSVETSGLFYESHVSKWYRGELPRQQLMLEPQMQRVTASSPFQQLTPITNTSSPMMLPLPPSQAGAGLLNIIVGSVSLERPEASVRGAAGAATASTSGASASMGATASSTAQAGGASVASAGAGQVPLGGQGVSAERSELPPPGAAERSAPASPPGLTSADGLDEAQQSVVRHQLEMLATPSPVLRWEGDVWSGVFMALIVQMPGGGQRGSEQSSSDEHDEEADHGAWRTQMSLQVVGLGKLDVELSVAPRQLDITLSAENQAVLSRLKEGEAALRSRLQVCGFDTIGLHMMQQPYQDAGDGA